MKIYKLRKRRFSAREFMQERLVRKYVFNKSVYKTSIALDYKGIVEVVLIDSEGDTFDFLMSKPDAKELSANIKKVA